MPIRSPEEFSDALIGFMMDDTFAGGFVALGREVFSSRGKKNQQPVTSLLVGTKGGSQISIDEYEKREKYLACRFIICLPLSDICNNNEVELRELSNERRLIEKD